MVYLFNTIYISVDLAHHEIFHSKVGKGGIKHSIQLQRFFLYLANIATSILSRQRTSNAPISLHKQAGWSAPLMFANDINMYSYDVTNDIRTDRALNEF